MWRQGPWKYVRYAGYHPQLFNLHDDPEEIQRPRRIPPRHRPKPQHPPGIISRLQRNADAQAKANDRHNFQTWRTPLTPTQYQEAMSNAHQGVWGPDDDQRLESWLSRLNPSFLGERRSQGTRARSCPVRASSTSGVGAASQTGLFRSKPTIPNRSIIPSTQSLP